MAQDAGPATSCRRERPLPLGASVATALQQAEHVTGPSSLVLVEIGGNDVLAGTALGDFERDLDRLLTRLREGGRRVILLELPLPPFSNRYGAVQRRVARQHQVLLIPKRVLLGVLTTEGTTLDTVHLSRQGHVLMAETMWNVIRRAFRGASSDAWCGAWSGLRIVMGLSGKRPRGVDLTDLRPVRLSPRSGLETGNLWTASRFLGLTTQARKGRRSTTGGARVIRNSGIDSGMAC